MESNIPNQISEMQTSTVNTEHKENHNLNIKPFYFETQSKKLKNYYHQHQTQLIGKRVLFNNSSATVKYFGPLLHEGKPGDKQELWIGVEWDEKERGKHNGTVNGYEYFRCEQKQGSMIKYQKIEFGYRLETALFKRYFRAEELHHAKDLYDNLKQVKEQFKLQSQQVKNSKCEQIVKKLHKIEYDADAYINTNKATKKIMVQFVGFDQIWTKINSLDKIQTISLAECRICDLGPLGHLNGLLKNLKVLSLQDNLLSDWSQIYQLGYQLTELTELSITNNKIAGVHQNFETLNKIKIAGSEQQLDLSANKIFLNLRSIILINTGLNWKTFFHVVSAFQFAHQFILCKNNLSDIQNIDQTRLCYMQETRFLNLEETALTSFASLHIFNSLANLQKLILNKNKIEELGRNITGFQELRHLSIQQCDIHKPVTLYQASLFPKIQSLNVKHNPIGERYGNSYVRMRAVAQLPKLTLINGASLKKYQRKDCQIFYLRQAFRQYFALKKVPDYDYDFDDFLKYCQQLHPNIPRLIKMYGNPYQVEKKKEIKEIIKEEVKGNQIKKGTGMVEVILEYKDTGLVEKKKLPLSWTLSSLKNFFSKTIKIQVGMQRILCQIEATYNAEQMMEDHKTLSFYNLKSNSRIIVERKSV